MNLAWRRIGVALVAGFLLFGTPAWGAVSNEQRREISSLRVELRRAGTLFQKGKVKEAAAIVEKVQQRVGEVGGDPKDKAMKALIDPVYRSIDRARALLELEGIDLPPLKKRPSDNPDAPSSGGVSFTKQVAPLLVGKCGNCHVRNARGMFSMSNYAALMKGNNDGKVVFPGDADGSRIVEVIVDGDMPRGSGKVAPQELELLKTWIKEGARFDGPNPQASLTSLAPNVSVRGPRVEVTKATGNETVSFSDDIAKIFNEQCANCHGNGRRPSGRFNITNFAAMLRGGDSGPPVLPRKSADSLLIKKLKGTADGERMPRGRPPLSDEVIAQIEKWIDEGATFDGPDPAQHIEQVAALSRAKSATHEELAADRAKLAEKNWRLGMPGIESRIAETDNFLLLANTGQATIDEYAKVAEEIAPKVAEIFGAASDQPLFKGRMSLFFFKQRYDYSEFGKMVEKRQVPREWRGHWKYNVVDAYGAVLPSRLDEYNLEPLLGQQIGSAYVASLGNGDAPKWFAEGSGRFAAQRLASDDARVVKWSEQLPEVLASMQKPDDFMTGKLNPEQAAVASLSFVRFLMKDAKRYNKVIDDLRNGKPFTQAFAGAYAGSPAQLAPAWARTAAREKPKTKRRRR